MDRFAARQRDITRSGGGQSLGRGSSSSSGSQDDNTNSSGEETNDRDRRSRNTIYSRYKRTKQAVFLWALRFHSNVANMHRKACSQFGKIYPLLKGIYKILVFANKFSYLVGYSSYWSPVLTLMGISLVKKNRNNGDSSNSNDNRIDSSNENRPTATVPDIDSIRLANSNSNSSVSTTPTVMKSYFSNLSMESKSALLVSVLVTVRVLELLLRTENTPQRTGNYFYNFFMRNNSSSAVGSSSGSQGGGEEDDKNKIIPPVPVQLKVGRGCVVPPQNNTCPLCRKKRNNPCASSSGFVFCYICLLEAVRESPFCPVTGISCVESDILRLYEDNTDNN